MKTDIKKFTDNLAIAAYGDLPDNTKTSGLCLDCKEPALKNCYSPAGIKEFAISGLCEKCFDKLFE